MTARTAFSKKQERGAATENQKRLASRPETGCRPSLDTCFYTGFWRHAIVVCRNLLRAKQRLVDLWRLTHRQDNVLQLTSALFGILLAKQYGGYSIAMTQINW